MKRVFQVSDALLSLASGSHWMLEGEEYENLEWYDESKPQPTYQEVLDEIRRLQAEYDAMEYHRSRAKEYPDFREYLDGIVKGDQDQVQAYIDACLAVKAKYPKPE